MSKEIQLSQQGILQKNFGELRRLLDLSKQQIASVLPKYLTPERMIRLALTMYQRTPQLQKCSLVSIVGSVIQASELGLELNGILGHAYLVPYWNSKTSSLEAQFQAGWRGLIALARRSGEVSVIFPELVYEQDEFDVQRGDNPKLIHKPNYKIEDRGGILGAYAVVIFKDSGKDFEFMPLPELYRIREFTKSRNKEGKIVGPWVEHEDEMMRKSPIRKLAKRLPMSHEMQRAALEDEYADAGVLSSTSYLDPHSEAVRQATDSKIATIVSKYTSADESQGDGNGAENESQETGDTEDNQEPEIDVVAEMHKRMEDAQRQANETGQNVELDFLGKPILVKPEAKQTEQPKVDEPIQFNAKLPLAKAFKELISRANEEKKALRVTRGFGEFTVMPENEPSTKDINMARNKQTQVEQEKREAEAKEPKGQELNFK